MSPPYDEDLAYIQSVAFGGLARGAASDIVRRLTGAPIGIRRVIDLGCGAGPLTKALVDAGLDVIGIDSSAALLMYARRHVPSSQFIEASIYDVELPSCDAIVAVGESLTYHEASADAEQRLAGFVQSAAGLLPQGGLLIFDVIETGSPPLDGRVWSSGEDWAVLVETTEDAATRRLERSIETFRRVGDAYRRGREIHSVRLFDSGALMDVLTACGFEVETSTAYGQHALGLRRRAFMATRKADRQDSA